MGRRYYLEPRLDSRNSFYKKAEVREESGKLILRSYSTDVAYIDLATGIPEVKGFYSQTTTRHIKDFIYQCSRFGCMSTKEIEDKFTAYGREAIARKEKEKEEKRIAREVAKAEREEERRQLKEFRSAKRKAEKERLKEEFTIEFEGILSKSEINKLVMTELNQMTF